MSPRPTAAPPAAADRPAATAAGTGGSANAPLQVRRIGIDTYRENVAFLRRDCPIYRAEGFQALSKVEVSANGTSILAVLNVVDALDHAALIGERELGLSEEAFAQLGVAEGAGVRIAHAEPPASIASLKRKIGGERLDADELAAIVRDIATHRYSKIELAAFIVATSRFDLDRDEVLNLTAAMVAVGRRLDWKEKPVVDKHCIGGIPGNRTSMLVVPIVAAHGMLMPKTSSRAITSPAGTADTMECLATVELPFERMEAIVRAHRACLAWGGRAELSPADDVLISVSRPLSVDSPGQMVASILSKKIAAGSTHLVLDIPLGPSAKVRHMDDAQRLKKLFEYVAARSGLQLDAVITDGRQPVGRGIGPALEARDVLKVLHNDPDAPADLRLKALRLAGRVLEFDPDLRGGDGFNVARDILDSGRALAKMNALIAAQGAHPFDRHHPPLASLTCDVLAHADGTVIAIDNQQIARIARLAGAPKAQGAGVDLARKLGEHVQAGELLYRIYAASASELQFARSAATQDSGYTLGDAAAVPQVFAEL
ncbi:MAG: thymidine phosphorylase family protein [Burkholderiales bacterium]|jgi:thymidine phosphorylase|nr:thymidine phosphorylase family protein [Burkholderiales bacterium]MCA3227394.1 thymidine phosphorylase family protein [Burkholderiales bacterium]MCE2645707.1 thymidine phosphorylase family protein [Burkholderiaceae bacterium]